jgi:hypothetical protein
MNIDDRLRKAASAVDESVASVHPDNRRLDRVLSSGQAWEQRRRRRIRALLAALEGIVLLSILVVTVAAAIFVGDLVARGLLTRARASVTLAIEAVLQGIQSSGRVIQDALSTLGAAKALPLTVAAILILLVILKREASVVIRLPQRIYQQEG